MKKYNTNSQTEHSKALRAKTAAQWNAARLKAGVVKSVSMHVPTEVAEMFFSIAKAEGVSRPQALKRLCEFYLKNKPV